MEEVWWMSNYVGYGVFPLLLPPAAIIQPNLVPLKVFAQSQRIQTVDAPPETLKHWEVRVVVTRILGDPRIAPWPRL